VEATVLQVRLESCVASLRADSPSIGIGGSLATPPLPHHRTYGTVYGGSAGLSSPDRKDGAGPTRAVKRFFDWCDEHHLGLEDIELISIAAYIEELSAEIGKPSVRQHLAAIASCSTTWSRAPSWSPFRRLVARFRL
jgi:hypothetical protein